MSEEVEELSKEELEVRLDFIEKSSTRDYEDSTGTRIIVFNDTDSCGISLSHLSNVLGVEVCHSEQDDSKSYVTPEGYELVQEFDDYINQEFTRWAIETFNSNNMMLNFKREKIIDKGIWLKKGKEDKEAKKNYIVHILDNEGVRHPKFKYTGVKFARTTIPKILKDTAKKIVEHMILTEDRIANGKMVDDLYETFCNMPIEEKSTIQRVKNITKYKYSGGTEFELGTPGHVRAALTYNWVIKELDIRRLVPIANGEIVKIIFLDKNNPFGITRLAYVEEWPEEFNKYFKVDNKILFEKVIYEEIKRVYESIGWTSYNPTNNYNFNPLQFFGF